MRIIKKEFYKVPVHIYASNIELSAANQIDNVASLPFAFHHVAFMPDCHAGMGTPIGTVFASKDVILPSMVGSDIGCFTGDTRIALLCGINKTLKELYDGKQDVWVYSLDNNKKIVPAKATPLKTRINAELMEIIISGGISIKCTPEHKFMLIDGSYKEAKDLQVFDSLMPLYKSYQTKDGYEFCSTGQSKGNLTHKIVHQYFEGIQKNKIIHHKNSNWFDNRPENLIYLTPSEHSKHHQLGNNRFCTEEFKSKRIKTLEKNGYYDELLYPIKKQIGISNLKYAFKSPKYKVISSQAGQRNKKHIIKFNQINNNTKFICRCGREIFGKGGFKRHQKYCKINHKVISIKYLDYVEDVYCLSVDTYHNFALEAGIFVHNCGMAAVQTNLPNKFANDTVLMKIILDDIRTRIPVGFNHHSKKQNISKLPKLPNFSNSICHEEFQLLQYQLGTLGGGNHFIEIQKGTDGYIWFMIHSGSRNLGYKVAKYYNKLAQELNKKWYSNIPEASGEDGLYFLPFDSIEGQKYYEEMIYCLAFAKENRATMVEQIKSSFINCCSAYHAPNVQFTFELDIHHNYAALENHYDKNIWIHRKGATSARKDQLGIIPGSQGTASYITIGKGNPESFNSCSHGAGRIMGRKEARRTLNLKEEIDKLESKGIIHSIRSNKDLDEASGSYKDIELVMEEQTDLVDIFIKLDPAAVIKGD